MGLKLDQYNPVYSDSQNNKEEEIEKKEAEPQKKKDKKDKKQDNTPSKFSKSFSFLKDERVRGIVGITLFLFSIFLFLSISSYVVFGASDQSLVENNGILENAKTKEIKNFGGPLGAAISEALFNNSFGFGSFFLIYLTGALGLILSGRSKTRAISTIVICLVAMITTSSIAGLISIYAPTSFLSYGGNHGYFLNRFLIDVAGIYGAVFFNILLVSILIALCINSLKKIYANYTEYRARRKAAQLEAKLLEEKERNNPFDRVKETEATKAPTETERNGIDNDAEESDNSMDKLFNTVVRNKVADIPPADKNKRAAEKSSSDEIKIEITKPVEIEKANVIEQKPFDPTAELSKYKFPPSTLLREAKNNQISVDITEQEENKARITKTLGDYGIEIKSITACVGPTVTLYEIIPAEGVKIAKIKGLEDDIALSLAALGIRIIAPIPGKGTIGIEVPNKDKQTVSMRSIIESRKFQECKYKLPIALGCTISNDVFIADLTKMPHILVAGATGMGKSVGLNAIITSLLYKKHPSELKFVMIDPKMVEFSMYAPLEYHYIAQMENEESPIITDMNKAVATLNSLVKEMEDRLLLLSDAKERNIADYNNKFIQHRLNPEKGHKYLPYIVVIIDELADLIMNIGRKEVETPIARITQKARAVGIHMILATQRPSTDIITGVIKANCPGRIAFRVTQMVDSRTILDRSGAQQLIGRGDMLITYDNQLTRVQCAFVDTPEVEAIVNFISEQTGFDQPYELPEYVPESAGNGTPGELGSLSERDQLFDDAAEFIVSGQTASTSSLQRRYSIGYNRAGKIMDQMEAAGIVGPSVGGKPRQVLVDAYQLADILKQQ